MRYSLRSALLLGSAYALIATSAAYADDPLVPEGAERPTMGKELMLPPVINEAPSGTEIVLPPPGQEHLLGQRPDRTKSEARLPEAEGDATREKLEAKAAPEAEDLHSQSVAEAEPAAKPRKTKKRKAKVEAVASATPKAETAPVAAVPADKSLYAGIKQTSVPDQSLVVPEDTKTARIEKTNARLDDAVPAMGGPELSGPPKPSDGMTDAPAPIRDGDTLNSKQERVLAEAPAKPAPVKADIPAAPAKAPAIERFEIAQATSAPLPVTPMKSSNPASPDWDFEFSGGVGFGRVEAANQTYFGKVAVVGGGSGSGFGTLSTHGGGSGSIIGNILSTGDVKSDDEDEIVTYEAAAKLNLGGRVEPLGGGGNVTPFIKVGVSGYEAELASSHAGITGGPGEAILAPGAGGEGGEYYEEISISSHSSGSGSGNYAFSSIDDIKHRGKQKIIRALLEYGQTWHGSNGLDVTGFAQVGHTRRDISNSLSFTGNGLYGNGNGGEGGEGGEGDGGEGDSFALSTGAGSVLGATSGYDGRYETDIDSNTTSFGVGAAVAVPLTGDKRLKADVMVKGSYDITTAEGRDRLRVVDNSNGAQIGASSTGLRKTNGSFGYGAGVGVSYEFGQGVGVRLGAEYTSKEGSPHVVRDGVNPSKLEFEREDVLIGTLTATIKF